MSKCLQNCLMNVLENWHSGVSVYIEGRVLESLVLLNYFHRYATFCHLKKCVCVTFVHKKSLIAKLISLRLFWDILKYDILSTHC